MSLPSPRALILGLLVAMVATAAGCGPSQQELQTQRAQAAAARAQTAAARAEASAASALLAAQKASEAADKASAAVKDATKHLDRASDKLEQLQKMEEEQARHRHAASKTTAAPARSGDSAKADGSTH